jgi:hypothetical protein
MENFVVYCGHLVPIFYENLVYSVIILNILWSFWYSFPSFGMLRQEKSGNPDRSSKMPLLSVIRVACISLLVLVYLYSR